MPRPSQPGSLCVALIVSLFALAPACSDSTKPRVCGNAIVEVGEHCDRGQQLNDGLYSGCNPDCTLAPRCGDGLVQSGEACDSGGQAGVYGGCRDDCTLGPHCGDGNIDAENAEQCDDGNVEDDGNGCTSACRDNAVCGDGIVQAMFEACDDGNQDDCVGDCRADCSAPAVLTGCGDGLHCGAETCDDGTPLFDEGNGCGTSCDRYGFCGDGALQYYFEACDGSSIPGTCNLACKPLTTISLGVGFGCRIRADNTVQCWSVDSGGDVDPVVQLRQLTPPAGGFVHVSAGLHHACALRADGTLACWGAGEPGTLGVRDFGQSEGASGSFLEVAAGGYHTCALSTLGGLSCFGLNSHGEASPPTGLGFSHVASGTFHSCALTQSNEVVCWGAGTTGLTAFENTCQSDYGSPWLFSELECGQAMPPGGHFVVLAAGTKHTCGIRATGELTCWGQLGIGSTPPAGRFRRLTSFSAEVCGIRNDGTLSCWGSRLCNAMEREDSAEYAEVAVSEGEVVAITTAREVQCWGQVCSGDISAPSCAQIVPPNGGP